MYRYDESITTIEALKKRIEQRRKRKQKFQTIMRALCAVCLLMAIGAIGGIETDAMSLGAGAVTCLLCTAGFVTAAWLGGLTE